MTLKLFEDNSLVREALAGHGGGKVLVIDQGIAVLRLLGDQFANPATGTNGRASSFMAASAIRDHIGWIDLGVRALDTHPMKSIKKGIGERDQAVCFGGVTFRPGEWI